MAFLLDGRILKYKAENQLINTIKTMIILIDGYNVLKMVMPKASVDEKERDAFIARLARYAAITRNAITIVFDGGEDVRTTFMKRNGVTIVYSGYRDSADTVIKNLLEEEQRNEVLLVSTDRELNRYAEYFDIPSMDSLVFYGYVRDRLQTARTTEQKKSAIAQVHKFEQEDASESLDALMQEAARSVMYKDEEYQQTRQRHKRTTSKLDKKLEKVVKKL